MSEPEKRCEYCGAPYIVSDGYCRNCWKKLPDEPQDDVVLLNGVKKAEWHMFIDKNSSRYVEIYAKNEGKKAFLHMNWAAFFFGINWLCYRKMYKYALIVFILNFIISAAASLLVIGTFRSQIEPLYKDIAAYEESFSDTNITIIDYDYATSPLYSAAMDAQNQLNKIYIKISSILLFVLLISNIIFGLFADCIYRAYILKHIKFTDGGTSLIAFLSAGLFPMPQQSFYSPLRLTLSWCSYLNKNRMNLLVHTVLNGGDIPTLLSCSFNGFTKNFKVIQRYWCFHNRSLYYILQFTFLLWICLYSF